MTLEVDPDRLYATSHQFDAAADKLRAWIQSNRAKFSIASAGADTVSKGIAEFFTETAVAEGTGALAQAEAAAANLYKVAESMRAAAQSYGLSDETGAGDLTSTDRT